MGKGVYFIVEIGIRLVNDSWFLNERAGGRFMDFGIRDVRSLVSYWLEMWVFMIKWDFMGVFCRLGLCLCKCFRNVIW